MWFYVDLAILHVLKHIYKNSNHESYRTRRLLKFQEYDTYTRDWLLWVTDGRAKALMDQTVQLSGWLIDELSNWLIDYLTNCLHD